ncbi:hypothetical protein MKY84_00960 [Chryseomicrobium sp. FSL W7-1435]|uniref:hypothetical protein n=1 Tax=Chryseomicrobium sp. FSL W7-1435 TaxID=2921704 RepID=UPI003159E582
MKKFAANLAVLVIGLVFLAASGWFIFQHDAVTGMLWAIGLWCIPFAFFILSIVALVNKGLPKFFIPSRLAASGLFALSLTLGASIVMLAFANAFVIEIGEPEEDAAAKIGWFGKWTGYTDLQENLEEVEGVYATYYVTPENKDKVKEIERMMPLIEKRLDMYLPTLNASQKPEIELHRDASTLQLLGDGDMLGGFYTSITERMHIHDNNQYWKEILIHEYAHYRIHQYQLEQAGEALLLPIWLEEGFADMVTGTLVLGPFDAYQDLPLEEVHKSGSRATTELNGVSLYIYGQLLVTELTRKGGVEQLQNWLLEEDTDQLEREFRDLYEMTEEQEIQRVIIEEYQKQLTISAESRMDAATNHFETWEQQLEVLKEKLYLPMYIQAMEHCYRLFKNELNFEEAAQVLNLLEQTDITRSPDEMKQERAMLEAGKGNLDEAVHLLDELTSTQAEGVRLLLLQQDNLILKQLIEDPKNPEVAFYLQERPFFGQGTNEWLDQIQQIYSNE